MKYLQIFKEYKTISYLPGFAVLHFTNFTNKLYLPNVHLENSLLGKWNSSWYNKEKYLIGHVDQDQYKNLIFTICGFFIVDQDELLQKNKGQFLESWEISYKHDFIMTPIHFIVSDEFLMNQSKMDITKKGFNEKPILEVKTIDKPGLLPTPNVNVVDNKYVTYSVCKTEKPEVYHVYNKEHYISTCLIPSMKVSKTMSALFEEKAIGEFIQMKMEKHEKSGKWIPIF